MLNVKPFAYGLQIENIYDNGSVFSPDILDITDDQLVAKFKAGVANVASASLEIGYCTQASVPHSIINGFKKVLAVAVETDITFPAAEGVSIRHVGSRTILRQALNNTNQYPNKPCPNTNLYPNKVLSQYSI